MSEKTSRRAIRRWLEDWDHLFRGGPPSEASCHCNGGPKPQDGITSSRLNKIMLEQVYEALPYRLKVVAYYRWVRKGDYTLRQVLDITQLTKDQYYYRCDRVVSFAFHYINGNWEVIGLSHRQ